MVSGDQVAQRRAEGWDSLSYGLSGTAGPAAVAAIASFASPAVAMLVLGGAAVTAASLTLTLPRSERTLPHGLEPMSVGNTLRQIGDQRPTATGDPRHDASRPLARRPVGGRRSPRAGPRQAGRVRSGRCSPRSARATSQGRSRSPPSRSAGSRKPWQPGIVRCSALRSASARSPEPFDRGRRLRPGGSKQCGLHRRDILVALGRRAGCRAGAGLRLPRRGEGRHRIARHRCRRRRRLPRPPGVAPCRRGGHPRRRRRCGDGSTPIRQASCCGVAAPDASRPSSAGAATAARPDHH